KPEAPAGGCPFIRGLFHRKYITTPTANGSRHTTAGRYAREGMDGFTGLWQPRTQPDALQFICSPPTTKAAAGNTAPSCHRMTRSVLMILPFMKPLRAIWSPFSVLSVSTIRPVLPVPPMEGKPSVPGSPWDSGDIH